MHVKKINNNLIDVKPVSRFNHSIPRIIDKRLHRCDSVQNVSSVNKITTSLNEIPKNQRIHSGSQRISGRRHSDFLYILLLKQ